MKRMFNLCLMATLLGTFGAACSKKTNSTAKEYLATQNALAAKSDAENKLKAKEAEEATRIAAQKERLEKAIPLSSVLLKDKHDEESNIAFYQILLASQQKGAAVSLIAVKNDDAVGSEDSEEHSSLKTRTNKDTLKLCDELLKRIEKKADTDLIAVDKDRVHSDVDGVVQCRSLSLASNYVEVSNVRAMCAKLKVVEIKPLPLGKITELRKDNKINLNPTVKYEAKAPQIEEAPVNQTILDEKTRAEINFNQ